MLRQSLTWKHGARVDGPSPSAPELRLPDRTPGGRPEPRLWDPRVQTDDECSVTRVPLTRGLRVPGEGGHSGEACCREPHCTRSRDCTLVCKGRGAGREQEGSPHGRDSITCTVFTGCSHPRARHTVGGCSHRVSLPKNTLTSPPKLRTFPKLPYTLLFMDKFDTSFKMVTHMTILLP